MELNGEGDYRKSSALDGRRSGSVAEAEIRLASDEQPPEQGCGSESGWILLVWSDLEKITWIFKKGQI